MPDKGEKRGELWEAGEPERGEAQGRGEGRREETKKKHVPTHGSWLCASESTCSVSKGQSWSCLPETGGKGKDGGTGLWQVEGWEPKHSGEGKGLCAPGLGERGGGDWCCPGVGPGRRAHKAKTDGGHRGDTGGAAQWGHDSLSVQATARRKPVSQHRSSLSHHLSHSGLLHPHSLARSVTPGLQTGTERQPGYGSLGPCRGQAGQLELRGPGRGVLS